jgi:hypothetical protein
MIEKSLLNTFILRGGKSTVLMFIFIVFCIKTTLFSQNIEKIATQNSPQLRERHLTFGLGMNWETRRDDLFSPLRYSGIGANIQNSMEWLNEKYYRQVLLFGSANQMQSRVKNGYNYEAYAFRYGLTFNYLRRILKDETRFRWYVGGGFSSLGSWSILPANVNNYVSFNVPTGFFASTYIRKELRFWRRNWILGSQLSLPVLAYNARPEFIGVWDEKAFLNQFHVVTLNRLFQLDWRWMIDVPLTNDNRLRFTYRWDYLNDRSKGTLQMGSQIGTLEFLSNLSFKK